MYDEEKESTLALAINEWTDIVHIAFTKKGPIRYSQRDAFRICNLLQLEIIGCVETDASITIELKESPEKIYLHNSVIGMHAYEQHPIIVDEEETGVVIKKWIRRQFFSPESETAWEFKYKASAREY